MNGERKPRPITERAVAEGEDAELAALLSGVRRVGTLQGVHVDLRHALLPQGEWEAVPWWDVWPNAGLVFPNEARDGLERLRELKGAAENEPAIFALAGDRLTIERVDVVPSAPMFDHQHDTEIRLAFLKLERPTGEVLHPARPLPFYGVGRLIAGGMRSAFDHAIERIMRHAGVDEFPTPSFETPESLWGRPLEQVSLWLAHQSHDLFHGLSAGLDGTQQAQLRRLANFAVLAGFTLGKIEAQEARDRAEKQVKGANMAALDKTPAAWIKQAEALAAAHPDWKRTKLAKALVSEWDRDQRSIYDTLKRRGIGPEPA